MAKSGFELLKQLLNPDPQKRVSAKEAIDSVWFKDVHN